MMIVFLLGSVGILVGSFLNVCIDRLPRGESVVRPPSHCDACGHRLGPADLVPIFSYLWLRGRCRHCGEAISPRVLVVELLTGALFALAALCHDLGVSLAFTLVFSCLFLVVAIIDLEHRLIPNRLVYPGMALALLLSPLWPGLGLLRALAGGAVGFIVLLIPYLLSRGGMGAGDVKLAALVGMVAGWPGALVAMFLAMVAGGAVAGPLLLLGLRKRKDQIPFGPFLSLGAVATLFYGDFLLAWYISLLWGVA